jgi:hypothetical protein
MPIAGGKDLRTSVSFAPGNSSMAASTTFTGTSSDPSTVVLAAYPTDPGQQSISLFLSTLFNVDCLKDSRGADLPISCPGYRDRITHVTCFPAKLAVGVSNYSGNNGVLAGNVLSFQTDPWAGPATIYVYLIAAAPANWTGAPIYPSTVRPGADPVVVVVSNSNPVVGTISSQIILSPNASVGQGTLFQPLTTGQTDIILSSDRAQPGTPDRIRFTVISPLTQNLSQYGIPAGFQTFLLPLSFGSFVGNIAPQITLTS